MGKLYDEINLSLKEWISTQKLFFVATAPLSENGHVNVSPKGLDTFRIIDKTTVAYLDLTGSGIETIAHLKENKRITIMFCAFDGPPKIVRMYGTGEVVEANDKEYISLSALFPLHPGARAIIKINLSRIVDSCGYAVPLFDFKSDRDVLDKWALNKGDEGLKEYRKMKNEKSIDDLDGLSNHGNVF
ncbi:MAG: pyridoxamine 5'-phosphate oxidase family protein [Bacteroidota bacterium]